MRVSPTDRLHRFARLLGLAALAAVALAPGAAQAQTCSGVLWLEFYDVDSEDRPAGRYVIPVRSLDIVAEYFHGEAAGHPSADEARRDPALTLRDREELRSFTRLYAGGTEVGIAPQCALALLHLEITYRRETMTLDLYRVPNHIGVGFDGPIPFRPGRYVLDFATAEDVASATNEFVVAVRNVRPADEALRRD